MPRVCYVTGKKTMFGKKRAWRGQKVSKGGFGLKPTGIEPRTFKPNLQKLRIEVTDESGKKTTIKTRVSTKAIRGGLVVKPLKRKYGYTRQQNAKD